MNEAHVFTETFKPYACTGDSIEATIEGLRFRAYLSPDPDYGIDDDDIHNTDQRVTGCNDEQQAKLLQAREAYARGEWEYVGVVLQHKDETVGSLWGIEMNYPGSNNSYLRDVADELAAEYLHGQCRSYGPGKFDTYADAYVYGLTLDGCDDEAGSVHECGEWIGRIGCIGCDMPRRSLAARRAERFGKDSGGLTQYERAFLKSQWGAIVREDSYGFVSVWYYASEKALDYAWEREARRIETLHVQAMT